MNTAVPALILIVVSLMGGLIVGVAVTLLTYKPSITTGMPLVTPPVIGGICVNCAEPMRNGTYTVEVWNNQGQQVGRVPVWYDDRAMTTAERSELITGITDAVDHFLKGVFHDASTRKL